MENRDAPEYHILHYIHRLLSQQYLKLHTASYDVISPHYAACLITLHYININAFLIQFGVKMSHFGSQIQMSPENRCHSSHRKSRQADEVCNFDEC